MTRPRWGSTPDVGGRAHRARLAIAHGLGRWLAALRAEPRPVAHELIGSWSGYVERERPLCIARQARWGVPAPVCDAMEVLLARVGDLAACETTLLHADLHDENVLVEEHEGVFEATGVIDFGDAVEGDPLFDLVTPVILLARGDGGQVRALFEGPGLGDALDDIRQVERFRRSPSSTGGTISRAWRRGPPRLSARWRRSRRGSSEERDDRRRPSGERRYAVT